jgi:hypothetical protein
MTQKIAWKNRIHSHDGGGRGAPSWVNVRAGGPVVFTVGFGSFSSRVSVGPGRGHSGRSS